MEKHQCLSYKIGDEVVFKCPLCPQYERRINVKNGKMTIMYPDQFVSHFGMCGPNGQDIPLTAGLCFEQIS